MSQSLPSSVLTQKYLGTQTHDSLLRNITPNHHFTTRLSWWNPWIHAYFHFFSPVNPESRVLGTRERNEKSRTDLVILSCLWHDNYYKIRFTGYLDTRFAKLFHSPASIHASYTFTYAELVSADDTTPAELATERTARDPLVRHPTKLE